MESLDKQIIKWQGIKSLPRSRPAARSSFARNCPPLRFLISHDRGQLSHLLNSRLNGRSSAHPCQRIPGFPFCRASRGVRVYTGRKGKPLNPIRGVFRIAPSLPRDDALARAIFRNFFSGRRCAAIFSSIPASILDLLEPAVYHFRAPRRG